MGWDQILVPMNPSEFRVGRMDPRMGRWRHQKASQWLLTSQGNWVSSFLPPKVTLNQWLLTSQGNWVSDSLPPKVTLKCDPPAQGFVESGWKNLCLVSWSLCLFLSYSRAQVTAQPWLHPSATWTRGRSWPCWCWTIQPARLPHFPLHRPLFTCFIACITTWHQLIHFLLSYCPLCLPMPHTRLCAHGVGTSLVLICHVSGAQHGTVAPEVLGTPAGCWLCFSTSSSGSPDRRDVGGLEGVRHREKGSAVSAAGHVARYVGGLVRRPYGQKTIWWGLRVDIKETVTGIGQCQHYPFKCAGTEWHSEDSGHYQSV